MPTLNERPEGMPYDVYKKLLKEQKDIIKKHKFGTLIWNSSKGGAMNKKEINLYNERLKLFQNKRP